jgi:hypothetical protein
MKRRNNSFAAIFLAGFLFLFFVFGLTIVRMWNQRQWVPNTALRMLFINRQTKTAEVLIVWPELQEPVRLSIPDNLYLTAAGGYGNYTAPALLTLGETEGVGEWLLADSLAFTLASPIHDVYWYSGETWSKWRVQWRLLRHGLLGQRSLLESIEMMNLLDRVSWTDTKQELLGTAAGVRQRIEVDGSVQDYLDQALLMSFLERNLTTMWPEAAELQVAVINASNMSMMASAWSRFARINGFDLVSVTDMPSQRQQTTLLFSNKELRTSLPGRALATLYPLATVEVGDTTAYRADAALLVGLDSWQWLNQRAAYLNTNLR